MAEHELRQQQAARSRQYKSEGPQLLISCVCLLLWNYLWVYLSSSYCLIRNCALVHAASWVPMAESNCS